MVPKPSPHFFRPLKSLAGEPKDTGVVAFGQGPGLLSRVSARDMEIANEVDQELRSKITEKNYPCVAAVQALFRLDYRIGVYRELGEGQLRQELGQDLLVFLDEQKRTGSEYLSFVAVFPETRGSLSEDDFEKRLWRELSLLMTLPEAKAFPWDPKFSADPNDKKFCFSWGGQAFFVVGLHSQSSRLGRRSRYPSLIFNVYEQFQKLADQGRYQPMVATNRKRDQAYQGSVNPMVEKYGETWEAIQFSGQENPSSWRCPFHHGQNPESAKVPTEDQVSVAKIPHAE